MLGCFVEEDRSAALPQCLAKQSPVSGVAVLKGEQGLKVSAAIHGYVVG